MASKILMSCDALGVNQREFSKAHALNILRIQESRETSSKWYLDCKYTFENNELKFKSNKGDTGKKDKSKKSSEGTIT